MKRALAFAGLLLLMALLATGKWLTGYLVRPLDHVFVSMAAGLLSLSLASIALIHLGLGRRPLPKRVAFCVAALTLAALPVLGPSKIDGFECRMRQTGEAEWLAIADEARALIRAASADGRLPRAPLKDWNRPYTRQLSATHPVLTLGDSTPRLFVTEEHVSIDWGSGITGSLVVEVTATPPNQKYVAGGLYRERRIYEHVSLVWE